MDEIRRIAGGAARTALVCGMPSDERDDVRQIAALGVCRGLRTVGRRSGEYRERYLRRAARSAVTDYLRWRARRSVEVAHPDVGDLVSVASPEEELLAIDVAVRIGAVFRRAFDVMSPTPRARFVEALGGPEMPPSSPGARGVAAVRAREVIRRVMEADECGNLVDAVALRRLFRR